MIPAVKTWIFCFLSGSLQLTDDVCGLCLHFKYYLADISSKFNVLEKEGFDSVKVWKHCRCLCMYVCVEVRCGCTCLGKTNALD